MIQVIQFILYLILLSVILAIIAMISGVLKDSIFKKRNKSKISTINEYVKVYSKIIKEKYKILLEQEVFTSSETPIGYILSYLDKNNLVFEYITNIESSDSYKKIIESYLNKKCFLLSSNIYLDYPCRNKIYIYKQSYICNDLNSMFRELKNAKDNSKNKDFIYVLEVIYNYMDEYSDSFKNNQLLIEAFEYADEFITDKNELNFLSFYKESLKNILE